MSKPFIPGCLSPAQVDAVLQGKASLVIAIVPNQPRGNVRYAGYFTYGTEEAPKHHWEHLDEHGHATGLYFEVGCCPFGEIGNYFIGCESGLVISKLEVRSIDTLTTEEAIRFYPDFKRTFFDMERDAAMSAISWWGNGSYYPGRIPIYPWAWFGEIKKEGVDS